MRKNFLLVVTSEVRRERRKVRTLKIKKERGFDNWKKPRPIKGEKGSDDGDLGEATLPGGWNSKRFHQVSKCLSFMAAAVKLTMSIQSSTMVRVFRIVWEI